MIRLLPAALLALLLLPAACVGRGDTAADRADAPTSAAPSVGIGGTMRALYGHSR